MQWDLANQLKQLQIYYSLTDVPDKQKKKKKIVAKQNTNVRQLICQLISPSLSYENNVSMTFEGVIVLRNPGVDFKQILGEIRCNMDSFTGKLQNVGLNRKSKAMTILIETDLQKLYISEVQQTYISAQDKEAMNALNVFERVKEGCYLCQEEKCPILLQEDWAAQLLSEDEDIPTQIFRADFDGEKPIISYVYNKNFIQILGIQPNLVMQLILKDQMIPQLIDETSIFIWTKRVKHLIESYDSPIVSEYDTMLTTYEGLRIGVKVRDTFLNTYDPCKKSFIYVQRSQFILNNDRLKSLLYNDNRINKNTNQLMEHEGIFIQDMNPTNNIVEKEKKVKKKRNRGGVVLKYYEGI